MPKATRTTTTTTTTTTCRAPGELVFIDGKTWCVGEKIISKNPRSRWNKTPRRRRTARARTPRQQK